MIRLSEFRRSLDEEHAWQPDGGKVTFESHPGGEVPHLHATCSKCQARTWFTEDQWGLLAKGCTPSSAEQCSDAAETVKFDWPRKPVSSTRRVEPIAWMWQHPETGMKGFIEHCSEADRAHWERMNKPREIVRPVYDHAPTPHSSIQATGYREAYERAKEIVEYNADPDGKPTPACYSWVAVMLAKALVADPRPMKCAGEQRCCHQTDRADSEGGQR